MKATPMTPRAIESMLRAQLMEMQIARQVVAAADAVDTEKQELIEALEFYAKSENWQFQPSNGSTRHIALGDGGACAREVLAKHGGNSDR